MSLLSLLAGMGQGPSGPGMGGMNVGAGPVGRSPLLDLLLPEQDRIPSPQFQHNFDGPRSGANDPGLLRPGQTSPQDILRNTIGNLTSGGGGKVPDVNYAPPRVPSGVLQGDRLMDTTPESFMQRQQIMPLARQMQGGQPVGFFLQSPGASGSQKDGSNPNMPDLGQWNSAANNNGTWRPPSPTADSKLFKIFKTISDRMEPEAIPSMQGAIPDAGNGQGYIDPYEKRAPAVGNDYYGGGQRVPRVATPPAPDNPFEYTPKQHPDRPAPGSLQNVMLGGAGTNTMTGSPMSDDLAEQGYGPDSLQAQAFAQIDPNKGAGKPAGAKSVSTPKKGTPKAQIAQEALPEPQHSPSAELRRQAISRIESGSAAGNYRAIGQRTKTGDRAYGRYQVMGNNIGPWTQQVLGRRLSPREFLANPAAQDAVFDKIFGEAVDRYGEGGAASVWFTGSPTPKGRRDPGGTVDHDYVARYMAGLGMPLSDVNNQRPGTGDASVMEAMQPGVQSAVSGAGGNDEGMMAKKQVAEDAAKQGSGGAAAQNEVTPEQLEQMRSMSLKERLALLAQFMQLGGFKPGEGSVG